MKLGVTATQRGMTDRQRQMFRARVIELRPSALIHGGCTGGDDHADIIAAELGVPRFVFPSTRVDKRVPDDVLRARTGSSVTIMPAKEPLDRNPDIVNAVDKIIACPQQSRMITRSGTWTTVRLARRILGDVNVEVIGPW
jgi:hypothetical protein